MRTRGNKPRVCLARERHAKKANNTKDMMGATPENQLGFQQDQMTHIRKTQGGNIKRETIYKGVGREFLCNLPLEARGYGLMHT